MERLESRPAKQSSFFAAELLRVSECRCDLTNYMHQASGSKQTPKGDSQERQDRRLRAAASQDTELWPCFLSVEGLSEPKSASVEMHVLTHVPKRTSYYI